MPPTDATRLWPGWSGLGAALGLLAQVHDATVAFAVPLLVLGCLVGVIRGSIDFGARPSRLEWCLLACAIAWCLSAWLGRDATRSLQLSMPALATLMLVPALMRETEARDALAAMCWTIAALGTAWSIALLCADASLSPSERVAAIRAPWLVVPNDLAFVAVLWPFWLRAAREARPSPRLALACMLATQAAALVLLQSRLGLLLCALTLVCTVVPTAWPARRRRATLAIVVAAAVPLASLLVDKGLRSLATRWDLWRAGWEVFLLHPWLGVGPHNYVLAYRDAAGFTVAPPLDPRLTPWPHSLPIELLAETGLIGCLAVGALLTSAALSMPGAMRRGTVRFALVLFVLLCLVEASTLRAWFWALVAIGLAGAGRQGIRGSCRDT